MFGRGGVDPGNFLTWSISFWIIPCIRGCLILGFSLIHSLVLPSWYPIFGLLFFLVAQCSLLFFPPSMFWILGVLFRFPFLPLLLGSPGLPFSSRFFSFQLHATFLRLFEVVHFSFRFLLWSGLIPVVFTGFGSTPTIVGFSLPFRWGVDAIRL